MKSCMISAVLPVVVLLLALFSSSGVEAQGSSICDNLSDNVIICDLFLKAKDTSVWNLDGSACPQECMDVLKVRWK